MVLYYLRKPTFSTHPLLRVFAGVAQPNVIIMYSIALVLGCNVLRVRQSILLLKTLIQIKTKHIFSSSYRDPF